MTDQVAEQIWVTTTEAAQITGYERGHIQRLARNNWNLPETERRIQVKRHSSGYMVWLPDLLDYMEIYGVGPGNKLTPKEILVAQLRNQHGIQVSNVSPNPRSPVPPAEETWVTIPEGATITGYNEEYLRKLARKIWHQPEEKRRIRLRSRSNRYELWLPDLVDYMSKYRNGPQKSRSE